VARLAELGGSAAHDRKHILSWDRGSVGFRGFVVSGWTGDSSAFPSIMPTRPPALSTLAADAVEPVPCPVCHGVEPEVFDCDRCHRAGVVPG